MLNKKPLFFALFFSLALFSSTSLKAQFTVNSDSAFKAGSPNSGKLWGYMFGDYYDKGNADSLNRGGGNQYTGVPKDRNAFQIRRLYLGYNYNISKKFAAEVLLEAAPGDALLDNKLAFYIKLANLRVKDLWKGTDLVIGQVGTPGFSMSSEPIWGYRSIEKTIIDRLGTPSYDLGASLQGTFDSKTKNFGYDVMVGNGTGARPEVDNRKWLSGDIWAKFLDKKLYVNFYLDYNGSNPIAGMNQSRNMIKGFVAYTVPKFTFGVEAFTNTLKNGDQATEIATGKTDFLTVQAKGISIFAHGIILKDKLNFFARYDAFNPDNKINNSFYNKYVQPTSGYSDPSTKEQFITAGLDYTPIKNVHFMPNIWADTYKNQGFNPKYTGIDLVYRLTCYFVFGK
ncbi:hypothetical protein ABIB40_001945 [Pedobacter sp. UYP30]|uniref:hypothetical protein n=1 Tax=Pedobacter sp. UYP30 TaxID=1756400 RepID=UPI003393DF06